CFSHCPRLSESPVAQERLRIVDIFSELLYHNLSSFRGVPPRNRLARVAALVSQLFTPQSSQLQFVCIPVPEPAPHRRALRVFPRFVRVAQNAAAVASGQ